MIIETIYCDDCEKLVKLTEDGYCSECGKHADNIPKNPGGHNPEPGDYYPANHLDSEYDIGGEG